jgi:predicted unusual protein kinase regulating ubiquinone biosynthesis (AarF/ABC1/UbiB family)
VLDPTVGTDAELGWALGAMFNPVLDAPVARLRSRSIADMLLGIARQYAGTAPPEMALFTKQLLYFERYSAELAPNWVLAKDPYLLRNVFPTETAALGVPIQD